MPAPAVETIVRTTAAPCLKIRPSPDTGGEPIACLVPGTHLSVLETAPYWRRVRLEDGREGWAAKKFLEPADPSPDPPPLPLTIPSNAWLEVHFVDVGQGDAVWIHTFDDGIDGNGIFEGRNVVIDGGPNSSDDGNPLLAYLQARAYPDAALGADPPGARPVR